MRRLVPLYLSIALGAWPNVGAAEQVQPPASSAIIPFDGVDEATLQAEVTKQALAFLETLHQHWGQAPDHLRSTVTGKIERDEQGRLIYLRNFSDHGVLEGYEFRQDSLVRGQFIVLQRPLNGLNEFIGYYRALKQALADVYGTPSQDRVVWDNDLYQPIPDYWGVAVMIGHLHYHAAWETAEGTITVELTGNQRSRLFLEYNSRNAATRT